VLTALVLLSAAPGEAQSPIAQEPVAQQVLVLQSVDRGNLILDYFTNNFRVELDRLVTRPVNFLQITVGRAGLVTRDFVKPGATVIDVGMNRVTDPAVAAQLFPAGHARLASFQAKGSVLVGDVHPEVWDVAGALTPVPGGVGPLTITMLMRNTLSAAKQRVG